MFFALVYTLKDPGGLTDYIAAEYIPDFLGGPYEVRGDARTTPNNHLPEPCDRGRG